MNKFAIALVLVLASCSGTLIAQKSAPPKSVGEVMDRSASSVESEFVPAAEAMPEDKYNFAPSSSMGEFKGVRTFAQQVRHVAAVNYIVGAAILGEKPPVDTGGESGPDTLKTKADIVKFLKDSFAYLHKALQSLNDQNILGLVKLPWGDSQVTRAGLAVMAIGHPFDHYGQMVEYLRMNGIVPPASRGQ